jgi:hypothetical protein
LARTGRKRKTGRRHPSGDLAMPRVDYRSMAALQPHRVWLPADRRLSEKAETPLGGLNLIGVISDEQYEAGRWYASVVARYRTSIEAPNPSPASIAGEGGGGVVYLSREQAEQRKDEYDRAFEAVFEAGQKAARTVARVAVYGEACPRGFMPDLIRGLQALAVHRGLTGPRKSVLVGK